MTENVGDDPLGGDELNEENELSFFLSFGVEPFELPFLTARNPVVVKADVQISSGIFRVFQSFSNKMF